MFQLIRWQIKKLFAKNGGILVILAYIVLLLFIGTLPSDSFESPALRLAMSDYYQKYGGKLTDQKAYEIEEHYQDILAADVRWNEAIQEYENQNISREEFQEIEKTLRDLKNEKRAFEKFYIRYQYCAQDPERRYLVDTQGWSALMEVSNPDYLMILFAIILAAIMDKADVGRNISSLIKTTRFGKGVFLLTRWITAFVSSILIVLVTIGINTILTAEEYTMNCGSAPLQSVSLFSKSTYQITILQGFLLGSLIRLIGLGYCSLLTVCFSELCYNVVLGSFCGVVVGILPYFVFNEGFKYLKLPFPTGMVQGFSYLHGVEMGGMQSLNTLVRIAIGAIVVLTVLGILIILRGRRVVRFKEIAVLCLVMTVLLSGCGTRTTISMVYSVHDPLFLVETDKYYVYKGKGMTVREKKTGIERPLFDDPLESDEEKMNICYMRAVHNTLFFLYRNANNNQIIQSINLDTGERKTLYEEMAYGQDVSVFDVALWQRPGMTYDQTCNLINNFLIIEDKLILLRGESITVIQHRTETVLYEGYYWSTTTDGQEIYFINGDRALCRLNPNTHVLKTYGDVFPVKPKVHNKSILYFDPQNGNALMSMNVETSAQSVLAPGEWTDFQCSERYILLRDSLGALWITDWYCSNIYQLCSQTEYRDFLLLDDDTAVVILLEDGTIQQIVVDEKAFR